MGLTILIVVLVITSGILVSLMVNSPEMPEDTGDDTPDTEFLIPDTELLFSGLLAEHFVKAQLDFGYRVPGTPDHAACRDYIRDTMIGYGYDVEYQHFTWRETPGTNIIARLPGYTAHPADRTGENGARAEPQTRGGSPGSGEADGYSVRGSRGDPGGSEPGTLLFGAHYDTRPFTDFPEHEDTPIMGANDGASGVAVLLELARVLTVRRVPMDLEFVFFDLEDSGMELQGFAQGSRFYAESLTEDEKKQIAGAVVVDMVGGRDLNIYPDLNSDPQITEQLWQAAGKLGYAEFATERTEKVFDDHVRLRDVGIPAALIIDFDYPYWHTQEDTFDKISGESLEKAGRVVELFTYARTGYLGARSPASDLVIPRDETMEMDGGVVHVNGNIRVNGTLHLRDTMLVVHSEREYVHSLTVEEGGVLTVADSIITSPTRNLRFEVHGSLTLTDSLVEQLWGNTLRSPHEGGIQIYSPDFLIRGTTVRYSGSRGIFIRDVVANRAPAISGSRIVENGEVGIYLLNATAGITGSFFEGNGMGAVSVAGGGITLQNSTVAGSLRGGTCTEAGCGGPAPSYGVELAFTTGISLVENTSFRNVDTGIAVSYTEGTGGEVTIRNARMEGTPWGIDLLHASAVITGSMMNASNAGISARYSDPILTNNTISRCAVGVWFLNSFGNLTGNTIADALHFGVLLDRSRVNVLNNTITDSSSGIRIIRDFGSVITGNGLHGNGFGVNGSTDHHSSPTLLNGNAIFGNSYGVRWLGNDSLLVMGGNNLSMGEGKNLSNPGGDIWQERAIKVRMLNAKQDVVVAIHRDGTPLRERTVSMWVHTWNENLTRSLTMPNGTIHTFGNYTFTFTLGEQVITRHINLGTDVEVIVDTEDP